MGFLIFVLLMAILWALVCMQMAKTRGRELTTAGVCGFFFGLLAVLYYLFSGDTTELRVQKEEQARANLRASLK